MKHFKKTEQSFFNSVLKIKAAYLFTAKFANVLSAISNNFSGKLEIL